MISTKEIGKTIKWMGSDNTYEKVELSNFICLGGATYTGSFVKSKKHG